MAERGKLYLDKLLRRVLRKNFAILRVSLAKTKAVKIHHDPSFLGSNSSSKTPNNGFGPE